MADSNEERKADLEFAAKYVRQKADDFLKAISRGESEPAASAGFIAHALVMFRTSVEIAKDVLDENKTIHADDLK